MLLFPSSSFRKRRTLTQRTAPPPPPPPVALTLAGATYDAGVPDLVLVFDRAVDVGGFDGAQIVVDDGAFNFTAYSGASAGLDGPAVVRVTLEVDGSSSASDVRLTASALSGIVAVDDGGVWDGVSGLALPFP